MRLRLGPPSRGWRLWRSRDLSPGSMHAVGRFLLSGGGFPIRDRVARPDLSEPVRALVAGLRAGRDVSGQAYTASSYQLAHGRGSGHIRAGSERNNDRYMRPPRGIARAPRVIKANTHESALALQERTPGVFPTPLANKSNLHQQRDGCASRVPHNHVATELAPYRASLGVCVRVANLCRPWSPAAPRRA